MILTILAQGDPLTGLPAPSESLASWWPFAMAFLSFLIASISAAFAAWVKISEKKVDHAREAETRKTQIEIEELKMQFAHRKEFQDRLSEEFHKSLEENAKLRTELRESRQDVAARERVINELRGTIAELTLRVRHLEQEIGNSKRDPGKSPAIPKQS